MKEMTISFKSELENIQNMRNMIASLVSCKNQTLTFINEVKTIVSEAITNSIIHGYDSKDDGEIVVKVRMDDVGINLEIIDFGSGIEDIDQARQILYTSKKESQRSGLGFTIMELFSTSFDVKSNKDAGTILDIYKAFE